MKARNRSNFAATLILAIFALVSVLGCGDDSPTEPVQPPLSPGAMTSEILASGGIGIAWEDRADNESGFRLFRELQNAKADEISNSLVELPANHTSHIDIDVEAGRSYLYSVAAFNGGGESERVDAPPVAIPVEEPDAPNAPQSLLAIELSSTEVALNWTDASNDETGFRLLRMTTDGDEQEIDLERNISSFVDADLLPSTTYVYRVFAMRDALLSAGSNFAQATTLTPLNSPLAPGNLRTTALSPGEIRLDWEDESDNEERFRIRRGLTAEEDDIVVELGPNSTTWTDRGLEESTLYFYRVVAVNSAGEASTIVASALTSETPRIPSAPHDLVATAISQSEITLNWSDTSDNESGFEVYRGSFEDRVDQLVAEIPANSSTWVDVGLEAESAYSYRVAAVNQHGRSQYSSVVTERTFGIEPVFPEAPTNLAATALSQTDIVLTWADASNNEHGFLVFRGSFAEDINQLMGEVGENVTEWVDRQLEPSTEYHYQVKAVNEDGASRPSNTALARTLDRVLEIPAQPTNLTATALSENEIRLTWADASDNESKFLISRDGVLAIEVAANSQSWIDSELLPGTTHSYHVEAMNDDGISPPSNTAEATTVEELKPPSAPVDLSVEAISESETRLTWNDSSEEETGFRIYRGARANAIGTLIDELPANRTDLIDDSLSPGTEYFYQVVAVNEAGESARSNHASVTTLVELLPPAAPGTLQTGALSPSSIELTWSDRSMDETHFKVFRGRNANSINTQVAKLGSNITQWVDENLTESTTYFYQVLALNDIGESDRTNLVSATTHAIPTVPSAPENLNTTVLSQTAVALAWIDRSNDEDGFRVYRGRQYGTIDEVVVELPAGQRNWTDTGLTASSSYYYRVFAFNEVGESQSSNAASATTLDPEPTPPTAPRNLMATQRSESEINLSWSDMSNDETGFQVYRGSSAGNVRQLVKHLPAGTTSWTDDGLLASTLYFYQVLALNEAGDAGSNIASARTADELRFTLQVRTEGSGSVSSSGGSYVAGAVVTLSASPRSGNTFAGWAGDASGSSSTTTITMNGNRSVVAVFYDIPELTAPSSAHGEFEVCWDYDWPMIVSTQDKYSIERSTSGPTHGFLVIHNDNAGSIDCKTESLSPGSYWYRVRAMVAYGSVSGWTSYSPVRKVTVAEPPETASLRIINNSAYSIISCVIDGQEIFPNYLDGIPAGRWLEVSVSPGSHSYSITNGEWRSNGTKGLKYNLSGTYNQPSGQRHDITFNNPPVGQVLSTFQSSKTWTAQYLYYERGQVFSGTVSYTFYADGRFNYYRDGVKQYSGTVSLVGWYPGGGQLKFMAGGYEATLWLTEGFISVYNGYNNAPLKYFP